MSAFAPRLHDPDLDGLCQQRMDFVAQCQRAFGLEPARRRGRGLPQRQHRHDGRLRRRGPAHDPVRLPRPDGRIPERQRETLNLKISKNQFQ